MSFTRRIAVTVALTVLTVTSLAGAASAGRVSPGPVSPNSPGQRSFTFTVAAASSTQSTGVVRWNNTTWALSMTATTGRLASGTCVTIYLDWRATGHHDSRGLRDCVSNDSYTASFSDSNTDNLRGGPSRMGICYGAQDTLGTCNFYSVTTPDTIPMDWTPWPDTSRANPCTLSFARRAANGAVTTFTDTHSQRNGLQGSTC